MGLRLGFRDPGERLCKTGIHLLVLFGIAASIGIRRVLPIDCIEGQTAFTATGCPCKLEGQKCRDTNTYCRNNVCTRALPANGSGSRCKACQPCASTTPTDCTTSTSRTTSTDSPTTCEPLICEACPDCPACPEYCALSPFHIWFDKVPQVTITCDIQLYQGTGFYIQNSCGALPYKECLFYVDYAIGTSPNDVRGGSGDTYPAGTYGYCPFTGTAGSTMACDTDGTVNTNKEFDNVLTSQYVGVDENTNEIVLKPQILLFNPPLTSPYYFVPSPDSPGGSITQYYNVECVDQNDHVSPFATFRVILPYCS